MAILGATGTGFFRRFQDAWLFTPETRMTGKKRFFWETLLLLVAATAAFPGDIKIFVTNDVHGYVFEDGANKRIGYALLSGWAGEARRNGFETVLLDAGDAFSGNAIAQFNAGAGVAELMGRMGYSVLAPGNHAFDYNAGMGDMRYYSDVLLQTVANFAEVPFEASCLNLASVDDPLPHLTRGPVTLVDRDGFRLIVLGVLTPYAKSSNSPESTEGFYDFGLVERGGEGGRTPDHAATRSSLIDRVAQAVGTFDRPGDVVLILSHIGDNDTEEYRNGQIRGSDLASIPNVDFVVDGHSHNCIPPTRIGGAWYANGGRYLEHFAEITLTRAGDAVSGTMDMIGYDQIRGAVEPSQAMLGHLRELSDRLDLGGELFFVDGDWLDDEGISEKSTPLGRFVAKTMRDVSGADLAICNSGSIRSGIAGGWATLGTLYDMMPFQNNLITFSMTGRDILAFFNDMPVRGTNSFPQFHGMTVYAWDRGTDQPLGIAGVRDGSGAVVEPEKEYSAAVSSFLAAGGDGYSFVLRDKRDLGDQTALFARRLKDVDQQWLDALRVNDALRIYSSREEAGNAFRNGEGETGDMRNAQ